MLITLLRRYLRPYTTDILRVCVLQLASTMSSLYLPSLNGDIIDRGVARGDTHHILTTGLVMLGISAAQITCSLIAVYFSARLAMRFGRDLRGSVFRHVGTFSAREVGKLGAPSLITRTTNDVQQVQMLVVVGSTLLLMAPIMCIGGIVMALREDLGLSWLLAICIPALAGSLGVIIGSMISKFRALQPKIDTINRVLREQITGMRVVRAFVREPVEAARFDEANTELTTLALRIGKLQAMMFPTVMAVFNTSSIAVLWFGAHRVAQGSLQVGSLMAYLSYLMQILVAVMMSTFLMVMVPRAAACAERLLEVLDMAPSIAPPVTPIVPAVETSVVECAAVEYRYPGAAAAVLSDITFTARPGELTAIIGSTGAGKTTLLELIARLGDPTAGAVRIDNVDLRERDLEELWSRVGMVPQQAFLFSGTIASNLKFGNPDATEQQMWDALDVAQAKDFVEAMPQKLEAPISQGGTNVSGGQRQRLSIARALLREPGVFLFDDAFSALDLATEARLRAALRSRTKNATVLLVAQRVASILDADNIIVLDGGKIVGQGTHTELLVTCSTYVEIVTSQQQAEAA